MTESAQVERPTDVIPSRLSTEQLEEELTLSAYDVHHVRGRRYKVLLAERRARRSRSGRMPSRTPGLQSADQT